MLRVGEPMNFSLSNQLDYSLNSLDSRKEKVQEIVNKHEFEIINHFEKYQKIHLSQSDRTSENEAISKDLEKVADYLLYMDNKEQRQKLVEENMLLNKRQTDNRKKKEILTDNFTFVEESKRKVNKNFKIYGKIKVLEKDRRECEDLAETGRMIEILKEKILLKKDSKGNPLSNEQLKKLRWYLIEIRKDEVAIKEQLKKYITFKNIYPSTTYFDLKHFSFSNEEHVKALLENYQELKLNTENMTENDFKFLLFDFEIFVKNAIKEPILKKVFDLKVQGYFQKDIANEIYKQFNIKVTRQRIAQIIDEIIPSLITKEYKQVFEEWIFTYMTKGNYKLCIACGQNKLATSKYFHKENRTKDKLNIYCKDCRKKK